MKKIILSAFALIFAMTSFAAIETGSAEAFNLPTDSTGVVASTPTFYEGTYVTWTGGEDQWYVGGSATYTINDESIAFKNGPTARQNPYYYNSYYGTETSLDGSSTSRANKGAYYQFTSTVDGTLYILGKFDTKRHYIAWQGSTRIPYKLIGYDTDKAKVVSVDLNDLPTEAPDDGSAYLDEGYLYGTIDSLGGYLEAAEVEYTLGNHIGVVEIPVEKDAKYYFYGTDTKVTLFGYCFATVGEEVTIAYSDATLISGETTEYTLSLSPTFKNNTDDDTENDTEYENLDGSYVDIVTNVPDPVFGWTLTDQDSNVKASGDNNNFSTEDDVYRLTFPSGITLYEDSTYTLTVTVYDTDGTELISADLLTITGTAKKDVTYSSVTGELSADENVFTLEFSNPVTIESATYQITYFGSEEEFESSAITSSDRTTPSTTWTLTLDDDTYSEILSDGGAIVLFTVTGTDADGLTLNDTEYNDGKLHFSTIIEYIPELTFDPEEGTYEKLDSITVTCEDGIAVSWNGSISITKDDETYDAVKIEYEDVEPDSWFDPSTSSIIRFIDKDTEEPISLTEAGTYVITISDGFYNLGEDGEYTSTGVELTYIITGVEDSGSTASAYECYWENGVAVQGTEGFYTISGGSIKTDTNNSCGTVTFNGKTLDECLHIEDGTTISFTTPKTNMSLTLVFGPTDTNHDIRIDGNDSSHKQTADAVNDDDNNALYYVLTYTLEEQGEHTLYKADQSYLFYINLEETAESTGINSANAALQSTGDNVYYNLNGQRVSAPSKGIYILNGKKILIK